MDKLCEKRIYEKNGKSIVRVYALQEIKIGTLILSESSQFKLENDDHLKMVCNENFVDHCTKSENEAGCKICFKKVFDAFAKMTPKNQKEYLTLDNKYQDNSLHFEKDRLAFQKIISEMFLDDDINNKLIKLTKWLQIFEIYATNFFGPGHINGIPFKTTKFKHSCNPNCEITWNYDKNESEIRTVSKIKSGEELRISRYRVFVEMQPVAFRKNWIKSNFGFECACDLCQIETLHEELNVKYKSYQEIHGKKRQLLNKFNSNGTDRKNQVQVYKELVDTSREQYKIAKECKASRFSILHGILKPAFEMAMDGYTFSKSFGEDTTAQYLRKSCDDFSKVALQLAKIIYGKNSLVWNEWNKKSEHFDEIIRSSLLYKVRQCILSSSDISPEAAERAFFR